MKIIAAVEAYARKRCAEPDLRHNPNCMPSRAIILNAARIILTELSRTLSEEEIIYFINTKDAEKRILIKRTLRKLNWDKE